MEGSPRVWPRPRRVSSNVCAQCRRQKQKCDRQAPCSNCVRRGIPHLCQLPAGSPYPEPERSVPLRESARPDTIPASRHSEPPAGGLQVPLPLTPGSALSPSSRVGRIWNSRGAASYHGDSYFGHQAAAIMMQVDTPELPVGMRGVHANAQRRGIIRNHHNPLGLYAHIWELLGHIPRRKSVVDTLTRRFFEELNLVFDGVHEETFLSHYERFWERKWSDDDLTTVDLRWLALLFIVLAFGELLDCPPNASPETQRECEDSSLQFFWASRKAVVIAPTFSGESPDLVRAGILITRYLIYLGRKAESWLTSSFAVRMAQAQGMHVDGENFRLPPEVLETRRCLWSSLYSLDRSISLALGRPYTINDKDCMQMKISNVWIGNNDSGDNGSLLERPVSDPSPTFYLFYRQRLSALLGKIHDDCFGLAPMSTTSYETYEKVLKLDDLLLAWAESLPPYFRQDNTDCSMDRERPYLYWQRIYLHSEFHFARITLHRTYVLLDSITDRFKYSRDACISSACTDLRLKLGFRNMTMADRLKAGSASLNLFNSALVLGIIAVRDPLSSKTGAILEDLQAYCEKQNVDMWVNEFTLAEIKVIELCIASAKKSRREIRVERRSGIEALGDSREQSHAQGRDEGSRPRSRQAITTEYESRPPRAISPGVELGVDESWLDAWFGPTRTFPEPSNFHLWEDLVGSLENRL